MRKLPSNEVEFSLVDIQAAISAFARKHLHRSLLSPPSLVMNSSGLCAIGTFDSVKQKRTIQPWVDNVI